MKRGIHKWLRALACCALCLSACLTAHGEGGAEVTLSPDSVEGQVDERLYGFLLEHLYHSVSNGVWGEEVWNRSFEELRAYGDWEVSHEGDIVLDAMDGELADFRLLRGRDFELSLVVERLSGDGPLLVGVRDQHRDRMLTNCLYWWLGTEGNSRHRLEARTGWVWHTPTARRSVVSDVAGVLPQGVAVPVRVRCEGGQVSGWVDGRLVFHSEIDDCPVEGDITVGGRGCRARFSHIRVTALDGAPAEVDWSVARHWRFVGEGSVRVVSDGALNQDVALCLTCTGGQAGVEQWGNFSVRSGDDLVGSVFLRGTVGEAVAQLLDGGAVLAEQPLTGISGQWAEFPLCLPVREGSTAATLRILTRQRGELCVDQVSLMHQSSLRNGGFRPMLERAVLGVRPAIVRWPGGSFSEHYHFEDGIGPQHVRRGRLQWDDFDPLSFGTDEFIAFCRRIGAEPQIVVPIGYLNWGGYAPDARGAEDWLQRALDWMDYCNGDTTTVWGRRRAANGHPEPYGVRYWEVDNEVWKMPAEEYVAIVQRFSQAMKARYPETQVIACGCGALGRSGARLDSLVIFRAGGSIDFISPHHYQRLGRYGTDGVEEYGRYLDKLSGWIAQCDNPGIGIYVSEWNLEGVDMRTGLFSGGFLNRLERTARARMAAGALFLRHTSATGWDNAFIHFDRDGWFPAPNYVVFQLWRANYLPLRIGLAGDTGGLDMVATRSQGGDTLCLKVVNPSAGTVPLRVRGAEALGRAQWTVVRADSLTQRNTMEHPGDIRAEARPCVREGGDLLLDVPPYSASVVRFSGQTRESLQSPTP